MELQFSRLPHIKIFVSSPGDVAAERKVVDKMVRDLRNGDDDYYGRAILEPILWENKALEGWFPPQEAIKRGLPLPSQCDIVLVILHRRMGTPLEGESKPDGGAYLSGTEWEYLDAERGVKENGNGRPKIYIFRRQVSDDDVPATGEPRVQYDRLQEFFSTSPQKTYHSYDDLTQFKHSIRRSLKQVIREILEAPTLDSDIREDDFEQRVSSDKYSPEHIRAFICDRANPPEFRTRALMISMKRHFISFEVIERVTRDPFQFVRKYFAECVMEYGTQISEEQMARLLMDNLEVSGAAVQAAKRLVKDGVFSTAIYRSIVHHPKWQVRRDAINVVREIDDGDAFDTVLQFRRYPGMVPIYYHIIQKACKYLTKVSTERQLSAEKRKQGLSLLNHYLTENGELGPQTSELVRASMGLLEGKLRAIPDELTSEEDGAHSDNGAA